MKALAIAIAAVGAAVIGLAACSHSTTPRAAPASHSTGKSIAPVSCSRQYRAWNHGEGTGLMDALNAVNSAATAGDAQALTAALKKAKPAVAKAARHPIPACADPRGYWSVLLMHVNAAAASKGSASSARAAIKDVPQIHKKLVNEVTQIAK